MDSGKAKQVTGWVDVRDVREAIDTIAQHRPDLWAKCYPRIYEEHVHGQYPSPKLVASDMATAALKIEYGALGTNEKVEMIWACRLAQCRVPTYWITPDMVEALTLTTPPQLLDLGGMHMPYEAAAFMLPKGALTHEADEGDALFVSYVRNPVGSAIKSIITRGPEWYHPVGRSSTTVFAHTANSHLLHWTIPHDIPFDLGHLDELIQRFQTEWVSHDSQFKNPFFDDNMTLADNRFMARVVHLVFSTLLLMLARPELVDAAYLRKRIAKRGEAPKEFWSPNIIGKSYKLRKLYIPQGGTHASPRVHWVRGFMREQAYGPKRSLRKPKWIEPFMRGGESD